MARKFSEVRLDGKIGLYKLLETKIETFNSRLNQNEKHLGNQFSNELFSLFPVERLHKLDLVTREIFNLIGNNPEVEMDDILDSLWQDVGMKYSSIYTTIETFNESRSGVYEITNTNEWRVFVEQGLRQMHQFDRQNNNTGNYEKLTDLETRTYSLLSLIKFAVIESKGSQKETHNIPESFDEAKKIADDLISQKEFISSGIDSIKQFKDFQVSTIDQALDKVKTEFSNKNVGVIRWLLGGIIAFIVVICVLVYVFTQLKNIGENWHLVLSMNLIGGSFFGYLTVFCFGNYKKMKQLKELYDFRATLATSFGLLLQVADEEQKKILYPKALEVIFKDLPESNSGQDVNINLPITEIMKGITGK